MQSISPRNIPQAWWELNNMSIEQVHIEGLTLLRIPEGKGGWSASLCRPPTRWMRAKVRSCFTQGTSAHLFIVSAHFTDNVLKEPNISIMPANPKWIGFQPIAAFDIFWNIGNSWQMNHYTIILQLPIVCVGARISDLTEYLKLNAKISRTSFARIV